MNQMKKSLLLMLLVTPFIANAQFQLNNSNKFKSGDEVKTYAVDTFATEGNAGPNQVWDFSQNLIGKFYGTSTYLQYTPQINDLYPSANFKVVNDSSTSIAYYKADDYEQSLVGTYSETPSQGYLFSSYLINNPVQKYMNYPLVYNIAQVHNFEAINYTVAAPDTASVTYRINSSTSMLYDAYGSITLPNQQHYNNVIRVKVTQTMEDSLAGVFKYIINTKMVTYNYYAENIRLPLMGITYTTTKISSFMGNQTGTSKNVIFYENDLIDGVVENVFNNDKQMIYPNPVENNANVTIADDIKNLEIYNTTGKLVFTYSDENRNIKLPLTTGMYFIKTSAKNGSINSSKLIIK